MLKFYTLLWFSWLKRMLIVTLFISLLLSLFVTFALYCKQGMPQLTQEVYLALFDIFKFWFFILLNFVLPLALFINTKYIFNLCLNGFSLKLLSCPQDGESNIIPIIGYGDLVKVWRKWLFLIVWNSAVLMVVVTLFSYFFTSYDSLFEWFSVYVLYIFILLSGFSSILLLASRCKRVKIEAC